MLVLKIFFKNKKYYFYLFLNKKYFKNNYHSPTIHNLILICLLCSEQSTEAVNPVFYFYIFCPRAGDSVIDRFNTSFFFLFLFYPSKGTLSQINKGNFVIFKNNLLKNKFLHF